MRVKPGLTNRGVARALAFVAVLAALAGAAELQFSASVDRTTVGLGEQLQLVVTVAGSDLGGLPRPQLPNLDGFANLGSTSSQSTNITLVNGRMSRQQTTSFIHVLEPKRTGTLTIGPAKLDHKGMTYQTQPVTVTVTKEAQAQPQRRQPQSPWDAPQRGRGAPAFNRVGASVDRTSVYVGEQLTATYTFYTNAQVANLSIKDAPALTGFWTEPVFEAKDLNWRAATLEGQQCNAATLRQVALFPTQAGELSVDRMALAGDNVRRGVLFDDAQPFEAASTPVRISARPLPEPKPADFSGGVGDFDLAVSLSKEQSENGEPLTLTVEVAGTGNIGLVGAPAFGPVSGIKLLPPETKVTARATGGRIAGTRRFGYPVLPQADGRHVIPELTLSFFDPKTGSYYQRKAGPVAFVATGAALAPAGDLPGEANPAARPTDIAHIKPAPGRAPGRAERAAWLGYPAGLLCLGLGIALGWHRRRLESDRGYARLSRSGRLVRKRLAAATRLLKEGNEREFYAALSRAVTGYVGDRFNLEAFGMTQEQLRAELDARAVELDTVNALLALVSTCDAARFAPGAAQCSPPETLERARSVLEKL